MKNPLLSILLALLLAVSSVEAFPLSGGNGQTNLIVFGTIRDDSTCYVDIGAPDGFDGLISLVDDEDRFHPTFNMGLERGQKSRSYAVFSIPKIVNIKRIKFEPYNQASFSIDWESVPEVSDNDMAMKLYNTVSTPYDPYETGWIFDIKLTNNAQNAIQLKRYDFTIVDQLGWEYVEHKSDERSNWLGQLMPGESMRFDLAFRQISKLSRPALLRYRNLTMDISAWT